MPCLLEKKIQILTDHSQELCLWQQMPSLPESGNGDYCLKISTLIVSQYSEWRSWHPQQVPNIWQVLKWWWHQGSISQLPFSHYSAPSTVWFYSSGSRSRWPSDWLAGWFGELFHSVCWKIQTYLQVTQKRQVEGCIAWPLWWSQFHCKGCWALCDWQIYTNETATIQGCGEVFEMINISAGSCYLCPLWRRTDGHEAFVCIIHYVFHFYYACSHIFDSLFLWQQISFQGEKAEWRVISCVRFMQICNLIWDSIGNWNQVQKQSNWIELCYIVF